MHRRSSDPAVLATDCKPGDFIRMERNPNYWGPPGVPDAIVFTQFASTDTMVQALKNDELDYVRGVQADSSTTRWPTSRTSGSPRASRMLHLPVVQHRGNKGGYHGSHSALADVAFRDALGFAIDRQELVDRVLSGHGVPGRRMFRRTT